MQLLSLISFALAAAAAAPHAPNTSPVKVTNSAPHPQGIHVSEHEPNVNWPAVKSNGVEFAYIKATEGIDYTNPEFSKQYTGAANAGLPHGPSHFARPAVSTGAAQADYFVAHGGGWSADGRTLPGVLYFEGACPTLSHVAVVSWIQDFSDAYHRHTGRDPVINTAVNWWETCTGNSAAFPNRNPLWIAHPAPPTGGLPPRAAGSGFGAFVQGGDNKGPNHDDEHTLKGNPADLKKFAPGPGH